MTLTPNNTLPAGQEHPPTVTVTQREVWISRPSAELMQKPDRLVVDLLASTVALRKQADGFTVKKSSVWIGDFAIYSRPLCRKILERYNAWKVRFMLVPHGDVFELKPFHIEKL
jgi:hypothetical protein